MVRGILILCAMLIAASSFGADKGLAVKVRAVEGGVTISMDGGKVWRKAKRGAELKAGTRLRTAPDGKADVEFGERYALARLRGDSDFEVKSHRADGGDYKTEAALRSGKLLATLRERMSDETRFEVEEPNSKWLCGVRGHDGFEIDATGGGRALKGTTALFVFTEYEVIFEWTYVRGGKEAHVAGTRQKPQWIERDLESREYEALVQEITELRKKYWKK